MVELFGSDGGFQNRGTDVQLVMTITFDPSGAWGSREVA